MGLITSTNYYTRRNVYHRKVRMRKLILVDIYVPKSQIQLATTCNKNENNRMPKVLMLNYGPNGRRQLGRPLKRPLEEAETGPLNLTPDGWWWWITRCFNKWLISAPSYLLKLICDERELLKKRMTLCSENNNNNNKNFMILSCVYVMMQAFSITPLLSAAWSTWCLVVVENSVRLILRPYYK